MASPSDASTTLTLTPGTLVNLGDYDFKVRAEVLGEALSPPFPLTVRSRLAQNPLCSPPSKACTMWLYNSPIHATFCSAFRYSATLWTCMIAPCRPARSLAGPPQKLVARCQLSQRTLTSPPERCDCRTSNNNEFEMWPQSAACPATMRQCVVQGFAQPSSFAHLNMRSKLLVYA